MLSLVRTALPHSLEPKLSAYGRANGEEKEEEEGEEVLADVEIERLFHLLKRLDQVLSACYFLL